MHRNSQKRFYDWGSTYFITTNTKDGTSFFREDLFCELFIENLRLRKKLKQFELYAFVIIPWHAHLLIYPYEKYNISKIMQSLKQNVSCDINRIIYYSQIEGGTPASRLQEIGWKRILEIYSKKEIDIENYIKRFHKKYHSHSHLFPKFQWQSSFHDHVIRGQTDFDYHYDYIITNPEKHKLVKHYEDYYWSIFNPKFYKLTDPA